MGDKQLRQDQESRLREQIGETSQKLERLQRNVSDMQKDVVSHLNEINLLRHQIESLKEELQQEKAKVENATAIIKILEEDQKSMAVQMKKVNSDQSKMKSLFGSFTPRFILAIASDKRFPRKQPNKLIKGQFLQTCSIEDLQQQFLDVPFEKSSQMMTFCESIATGYPGHAAIENLSFMECPRCKITRISSVETRRGWTGLLSDNRRKGVLDEFPTFFRQEVCSSIPICSSCFADALKDSIANNWWYELGSTRWLKCPMENCERQIDIQSMDEIGITLKDLSDDNIKFFKSIMKQVLQMREALSRCNPRPNQESLSLAASLHKQLVAYGCMDDFFSRPSIMNSTERDDETDSFEIGQVMMIKIDRVDFSIPIFTNFFKGSRMVKDCTICLESFHDIEKGSETDWISACEGFEGPWMSRIFSFPTQDMQNCEHSLDVCKSCFATHLDTQLIQNARNPLGSLKCPKHECRRVLETHEIRALASNDTIQKFDRYLLRQHLSNEPGFIWCLRPGCDNGFVHEEEEFMDPHIRCSACNFEMCFTHQIPWHEGKSCEQYDRQREHGDPDHDQTQEWLRINTKHCPSCGVSIQKGNACFHMTCSTCRHEFCWICLADYSLISPRPGDYVRNAHNAGCMFLKLGVQPTQLRGNNIDKAIRRRRT